MRPAGGIAVLAALASVPLWLENPYHLHVLIMAGIFAVLALSLNLLLGYAGQLSLGHAAFFGLGAYATALSTVKLGWSPWAGLVLALGVPGVAGWAVGRLALRIRGAYFVLLTVSFAGVISLISVNWMELTNGPLGIPGVPALAVECRARRVAAPPQARLLRRDAGGRGALLPGVLAPGALARGPGAGRAPGE